MNAKNIVILSISEANWENFADGSRKISSPAVGIAYYSRMLGCEAVAATRVGSDQAGKEFIEKIETLRVSTEYIQIDEIAPTGVITIEKDADGKSKSVFPEVAAWDYLEWTDQWEAQAKAAKAIVFNSLSQRSQQSRSVIRRFVRTASDALRLFDANLNAPFYSTQLLNDSFQLADAIKLKESELQHVLHLLGLKSSNLKANIRMLIETFGLKLLCLTRGERGCIIADEENMTEHSGFKVKQVFASCASDAFTAAALYHYLLKSPLKKMAEAANRLASYVISQSAPLPRIDKNILNQVIIKQSNPVNR